MRCSYSRPHVAPITSCTNGSIPSRDRPGGSCSTLPQAACVGRLLVDEEDRDAVDDRVLVPLLAHAVAQRAAVARADELERHYDLTERMFTLSASVVGA